MEANSGQCQPFIARLMPPSVEFISGSWGGFPPTHVIGLRALVLFIILMIDLDDDVELLAIYMADSYDLLSTSMMHFMFSN